VRVFVNFRTSGQLHAPSLLPRKPPELLWILLKKDLCPCRLTSLVAVLTTLPAHLNARVFKNVKTVYKYMKISERTFSLHQIPLNYVRRLTVAGE
jgi:hypothetical protein